MKPSPIRSMVTTEDGDADMAEALEDLVDGVNHTVIRKGTWFLVSFFHPIIESQEIPRFALAAGVREDGSRFYCVRADQTVQIIGKCSELGGPPDVND